MARGTKKRVAKKAASAPAKASQSAEAASTGRWSNLKATIEDLYEGTDKRATRFRYALLVFDLLLIAFFIFTVPLHNPPWIIVLDVIIAIPVALDFAARLWISRKKIAFTLQLTSIADILIIISLLLPLFFENLAFLRVLRSLRLLRSHHVMLDLRRDVPFVRRNEEVLQSLINLVVFVFTITALVYVLEDEINPQITTYMDALYFTVTTLTTTGFGDITLQDRNGRLLSIIIMVVGVALFLRLVQTVFRPSKVRYTCPDCGLTLHDPDAIHCKHCGRLINIKTEGVT
jgi:voltage-gated potassium channel